MTINTPHTSEGSIPTLGCYPLYEYPAYTFAGSYENDEFQKKVITLDCGYNLVLAPPECGKTDILAERVVRALSCCVLLDEILIGTGIFNEDSETHRFVTHLRNNYLLPFREADLCDTYV